MPYRRFVWPALAAILAIVAFLVVRGLGDSLTYYLTPSEAASRRAEFPDGERFRLGGLVMPGTLSQSGAVRTFDVTDGATTITVRLTSPPPPLFQENVGVVVEGSWQGNLFAADVALVRHDETYEPPTGYQAPSS
ncbi:MAG TPA: cytochrome c maturation protein CcmE [Acidimicrobiia bacterium]|jgi:cytochrome c-type biogenesis protein CcmE